MTTLVQVVNFFNLWIHEHIIWLTKKNKYNRIQWGNVDPTHVMTIDTIYNNLIYFIFNLLSTYLHTKEFYGTKAKSL